MKNRSRYALATVDNIRSYLSYAIIALMASDAKGQNSYYGKNNLIALITNNSCQEMQLPGNLQLSVSGSRVSYIITDHLGSARTIIDSSTKNPAAYSYTPYGTITGHPDQSRPSFQGTYIWDEHTKMYHTQNRTYDPAAVRFIQRDPFRSNDAPYAFTNCNPEAFTDRSGLYTEDFDDETMAAFFDHPSVPELQLDEGSYQTLKLIEPKEAFVGVFNVTTGEIYLNPVRRRGIDNTDSGTPYWSGEDFNKPIQLLGRTGITQIEFDINAPAAHTRLMNRVVGFLKEDGTDKSRIDGPFAGFGLRWDDVHSVVSLTPRSRSRNMSLFNDWIMRDKDLAFEEAHRTAIEDFYTMQYNDITEALLSNGVDDEYKRHSMAIDKIENLFADENGRSVFVDEFNTNKALKIISTVPERKNLIGPVLDMGSGGLLPSYLSDRLVHFLNNLPDLPPIKKIRL